MHGLWVAPALADVEPEPDPKPAPREEPSWISRANKEEAAPAGRQRPAALRSIGALALMIGALMMTHHWMRRRFATAQPIVGSRMKVLSRLRLGARQELVVIEWDGDQVMLGIGPTFMHPLHTRREGVPAQPDAPALEEADYAGR